MIVRSLTAIDAAKRWIHYRSELSPVLTKAGWSACGHELHVIVEGLDPLVSRPWWKGVSVADRVARLRVVV